MRNSIHKLYNKYIAISIITISISIYTALTLLSGGSGLELFAFFLYIFLLIFWPGVLLAHVFAKFSGFVKENEGFSIILFGIGFFAVLYCVLMRISMLGYFTLNLGLWMRIIPTIVYLFSAKFFRKKITEFYKNNVKKAFEPENMQWIFLFAALLAVFSFTYVVKNAHPSTAGDIILNQDFLWNVGNAESFRIRFIPEDIRFVGVQLHYHYLTELVAGALSLATYISAYNILGFYLGPYIILALIYSIYTFGKTFYNGSAKKAKYFTFALFIFGCASLWKILPNGQGLFWNTNIYHMVSNINSQGTAIIFLCIYSSVLLYCMHNHFKVKLIDIGILVAAFFLLCFAKGPVAAIVVCASSITLLWLFAQKKVNWKGFITALLLGGLFIVVYTLFFSSGANTSVRFDIWRTLEFTYFAPYLQQIYDWNLYIWYIALFTIMVFHTFCMAPFQFFLYGTGLIKDVKHLFNLEGDRLYANSVAIGGMFAFYLFNHPSMSQLYFIFLALFFINLLAADKMDQLQWKKISSKIAMVLACVGLTTNVFLYINLLGSGARQFARNNGIIEKYPYEFVMNIDDEIAMQWLRENTGTEILFATNRIHTGAAQEGLSNLYSALSGRQGYMEGFKYALTNMGVPEDIIVHRLEVNNALFEVSTSPDELQKLCEETGITHIVYCEQFWGDEEQLACFELVFESDTVRIYATGVTPHEIHSIYV